MVGVLRRMLPVGLLTALLTSVSSLGAAEPAPAGRVEFAIGNPTAAGKDNRARPLKRGMPVFEGDLISTGAGRVQVRFTDGGFMSLQPQTQFKVEQYRYTGKADGTEKGIFNLVKGGMRTITGLIGKNESKNYRVHTKVATIGVRGTEYSLSMDTSLQGSVAAGQIDVCNAGGCAPFARGESFVVPHGAARPMMTLRKASLAGPQPGEQHRGEPPPEDGEKADGRTAAAAPPGAPPDGPPPAEGAEGAPPPPPPDKVAGVLPPPGGNGPGFVQGDATDSAGASAAFKLTGPHFLGYAVARYLGSSNPLGGLTGTTMGNVQLDASGLAMTVGPYAITGAKGGANGFSAGGEGVQSGGSLAIHYALGYPTLPSDIQALQLSSPVLAYAPLAGSNPTGFFGGVAPSKEDSIGRFLGGSMHVNLSTNVATVQMDLELGGTVLGVNGPSLSVTPGSMPSTPATTFAGSCTTGTGCQMMGFLVGPKAQGAMLVYEFGSAPIVVNSNPTTVTARGMAVFQRNP